MDTQTPPSSPANSPHDPAPPAGTPRVLLSWTAVSHHDHERTTRWYAIGGTIILCISAYGILSGAWSLTLVSLLLGGVYFLVRREPMPMREIRIETDGVQFENSFTPWTDCKEFWIVTTPLFSELRITRKSRMKSDIRIHTSDIDTTLIRSTLSQFVFMRADQRERFLDAVLRLCKL